MIAPTPFVRRVVLSAALVLVTWAVAPTSTTAQTPPLRPTWDCLPEETVFAIRIPNGRAIAEAFVENTKLGTVLFSEKRIANFQRELQDQESTGWSEFRAELSEYGFTPEELIELLAGESGYAVVVSPRADQEVPLVAGLAWLQPGDEQALRLFDAIGEAIQKHEDDEHPVRRVDVQLEQCPVMQLTVPVVNLEYEGDFELPDDYDELSEDEQEQAWEQAEESWEASAVKQVTFGAVLVGRMGDRLLVANTFDNVDADSAPADMEQLTELLARLIRAHSGAGRGFVARHVQAPGVADVFEPGGVVAIEMLGDIAPLLKLARATAESREETEQVLRMCGADQLGAFALRLVLRGSELHSRAFLAAAEPRDGLLKLLDQQPLSTDPPPWVPASVIGFTQWSFDVGQAYAIVKQAVLNEFPEESERVFQQAEAQVAGVTQASLEELLASLGNRFVILSFEPLIDGLPSDADDEFPEVIERNVTVAQVADEGLWSRVLQALAPLGGMMQGLTFGEEQGFRGWRLETEAFQGGLFVGKGYLIFAHGPDVLATALSSLNDPPEGSDGLRGSKLYARASAIAELRPCVGFDLIDGNRYAKMAVAVITQAIAQMETLIETIGASEDDDADMLWLAIARALVPTEDEVDGTMGVIVSLWEVTEHGVQAWSVHELPPAD